MRRTCFRFSGPDQGDGVCEAWDELLQEAKLKIGTRPMRRPGPGIRGRVGRRTLMRLMSPWLLSTKCQSGLQTRRVLCIIGQRFLCNVLAMQSENCL